MCEWVYLRWLTDSLAECPQRWTEESSRPEILFRKQCVLIETRFWRQRQRSVWYEFFRCFSMEQNAGFSLKRQEESKLFPSQVYLYHHRPTTVRTRQWWGDPATVREMMALGRLEWLHHLAQMSTTQTPHIHVSLCWLPQLHPRGGPRKSNLRGRGIGGWNWQ